MPAATSSLPSLDTVHKFYLKTLHPTFGAEIRNLDLSKTISNDLIQDIQILLAKYGFCVFRNTGLDDASHVEFSSRFGELDNMKRFMTPRHKPRYGYYELIDAGNIGDNGEVLDPNSIKAQFGKGNALWHVDSSFLPRRGSLSMLRSYELPPPGQGGNTDFADSRTAFEELPDDLKQELLSNDYVAAHSIAHSRKLGSPEFFKDLDPLSEKMFLHRVVQRHEPSDRMNLYIAAHIHHIEGVSKEQSEALLERLFAHATQKKYTVSIPWESVSDLIIWDNTCVLHRAAGGRYVGKYRRDLRRTTILDNSSTAWGCNEKGSELLSSGFTYSL